MSKKENNLRTTGFHLSKRDGIFGCIVNGSSLEPGMYLYALVIDGKEVDIKRMILTK